MHKISVYQGFPTTAAEAIACNSQVVCCSTSSFREVLGHWAVFLDNLDINEIKNAVFEVIDKKTTRDSASYIPKSNQDKSVNQLVRVYESTVYGGS